MYGNRVALNFLREFNSANGRFFVFCGNKFFAIGKNWFFLLGINFCDCQEVAFNFELQHSLFKSKNNQRSSNAGEHGLPGERHADV